MNIGFLQSLSLVRLLEKETMRDDTKTDIKANIQADIDKQVVILSDYNQLKTNKKKRETKVK